MGVIDQDAEPARVSSVNFRLEIKAQFSDPASNKGIRRLFAGVHLTRFLDPASERLADKLLLSRLWLAVPCNRRHLVDELMDLRHARSARGRSIALGGGAQANRTWTRRPVPIPSDSRNIWRYRQEPKRR